MNQLLVVGAGGFALETVELIRAVNAVCPTFELLGYLDDNPDLHGTTLLGAPVLGPIEDHRRFADALIVVCLGSPRNITLRREIVERLDVGDERWATLVHPTAVVPGSVRLGLGTVVHAGVVFTADIVVGRHVEIMPMVTMTHGNRIDDHVTFGSGVRLAGNVRVGDSAYLGSGALVRENIEIGAESLIGMGSVVTRSVPPNEVWAGCPAKPLPSTDARNRLASTDSG